MAEIDDFGEDIPTVNVTAILNGGEPSSAPTSFTELMMSNNNNNNNNQTASSMTTTDNFDFTYRCAAGVDPICAETCVSLEACLDCECQPVYLEAGGPWHEVMDVILCLLPILYLIYATVKKNPTPTTTSLPVAAGLMLLVRLMYLGSNPILSMGCIILGFHEALTPLSIMAGAITLFETMEATKCLPYMMREMKALTAGHPVAECMLLFAFAYLVEGASGFGTPVALGAPMLVSTGNPAMESVVIMLCFNTFATVWGAVGTPLWFGFGDLGLTEDELAEVSIKAAICMVIGSFLLLPFIMTILVPFKVIRANLIFMILSTASVMGPVVALANFNYEFPSLLGGLIGFLLTAVLIQFKVGLASMEAFQDEIKRNNNNAITDSNNSVRKMVPDLADVSERQRATVTDTEDVANEDNDHTGDEESGAAANGSKLSGHWNSVDVNAAADGATETVVHVEEDAEDEQQQQSTTTGDANDQPSEKEDPSKRPATRMPSLYDEGAVDDSGLGPRKSVKEGYLFEVIMRTFPIWAVVVLLILTRIQAIGIKEYLTKQEPYFSIYFGTYGEFRLSASIVFQLRDILTYPGLGWKYELFYIPFLVPFVLVSALTMGIYRKDMTCQPKDIAATVVRRLTNPAVALMGALVLVQLMIRFGTEAPAYILGNILADWLKEGFIVISPLLGALGSFFSGSTTVSNLTFGEIQRIAAKSIGTSVTSMLALQVVGASAGNGICLNNIIAALAVVGLDVSEGQILVKTCRYVFALTTIATVVMLAIFFRFD